MRKLVILLFFMIATNAGYAVGFTSLSSSESVALVLEVQQKSYVDVMLNIDLEKIERESLALKVKCTINGNVFNEYVTITSESKGPIKRILLEPGQLFKAELFLHEKGIKTLTPVSGTFELAKKGSIKVGESVSANTFLGGLWSDTQLPLFRVIKEDAVPKTFRVKFNFNDQFEYDQLFYKLKVISPTDGILLYEESIAVNKGMAVGRNPKNFQVELTEVPISAEGTYYFQLQHIMESAYVNGIESVNYELIDK